jgi:Protein of unknown function (DUF3999)
MKRSPGWALCAILAPCAILGPPCLHGAELSPQDFAFGLPVVAATEAPAYRIAVPLTLYQNTFREDLTDIRVFNADAEIVPYAARRNVPLQPPATPIRLPLFSLATGSRAVIDGVRVIIVGRASATNWQAQSSKTADTPSIQYILDGRDLTSAVAGLQLDWPETELDFSGRIQVEASDDLSEWRTLVRGAPIVNLRASGQAIIQNRVALPIVKAKFWRLSWLGAPPAFSVTAISAEPAGSPIEAVRASLEVAGSPDPTNSQEIIFDLGAHAPVDRVNVLLPEVNAIVKIELSSRPQLSDSWRSVARAGLFRIAATEGENQNAPLQIPIDRDRYWKARLLSDGRFSQKPLYLRVQWIADEVTFLARGHGPFLLAYGSSAAPSAEVDLNMLPANIAIASATTGDAKLLGGPLRLKAQAPPFPRTQLLLWGALLLAVLVLAWMAFRLMNEQRAA